MRAEHWTLPNAVFEFEDGPKIMGIVNVTPDSFSDGGHFFAPDDAHRHALELIDQGADILDIGGESTRPHASPVSEDEERRRVVPVIQRLRETTSIPISIDTTHASVAHSALEAGAQIVNDISGMRFDDNMPHVVAQHRAAVVLMHTPGRQDTMHRARTYEHIASDVLAYLDRRIDIALNAGIERNRICIDPGFGFGKDAAQNLQLFKALPRFVDHGFPVLVGVSRKRTIRHHTGNHTEALDHGTSVLHAAATTLGAQLVRAHNVRAARAAIAMQQALDSAS